MNRTCHGVAAARPALADYRHLQVLTPVALAADTHGAPFHGATTFLYLRFGHDRMIALVIAWPQMNATAAEVRAWALTAGIDVPPKGKLSADVWEAFDLVHSVDDDGALLADLPDPHTPEDQAPDDRPGSSGAPDPQDTGPVYTPDPEPKRPRHTGRGKTGSSTRVTDAIRKDIRAKTALFLTIPAAMFERRDPICGEVAMQVVPGTSVALADIFCDSPDVVAFFTSTGGGFMRWLQLAIELQPLGEVLYQHHIAKSIGIQGGGPGSWNGEAVPADDSRYHAPAL